MSDLAPVVGTCICSNYNLPRLRPPRYILPIIVISQLCCTSLWFATNRIMKDLSLARQLNDAALGHLTAAVQLGFITGTLVYALLMMADRFPPARVFFWSALLAAACNLSIAGDGLGLTAMLALRFGCGFFLAGIYPVGMKIASDYYEKGLGKSLSYLVGALVLGTALPHLLYHFGDQTLPWKFVLYTTSALAITGGFLMWIFVPNGPFYKAGTQLQWTAAFGVFKNLSFRRAALGYFGHMWELYAFWAFVPVFLQGYASQHPTSDIPISLLSFISIAIGLLGCIIGGNLSLRLGPRKVASWAIVGSGLCCLLSPILFSLPLWALLVVLFIWGMMVIADSPLFSTIVAQSAPIQLKGTGLTIVNCIGFAITIVSIQLLSYLSGMIPVQYLFLVLALGPLMGFITTVRKWA